MDTHLLELSADKLLTKFGAGEHKPGSGSAAAFHGMLSAQLIRTVIHLTTDSKRSHLYSARISELLTADTEIKNRIYPRLENLFLEDSAQFDKAIQLRKARDEEKDKVKRKKLTEEALTALIPATELPIEIAELCIELANYAALIFDYGFKSARGDSGVAMNGATSSIAGCLSIIELNLLSFTPSEWMQKIRDRTKSLRATYDDLIIENVKRLDLLQAEVKRNNDFHNDVNAIKGFKYQSSTLSNQEIENLAINFQRVIWKYRNKIWKNNTPENPLDSLNPEVISKILGYEFNEHSTLGQHEVDGKLYEVAGLINNQEKEISISNQFPLETQRFTAFHELGHALLHEQNVLHRDRALDGSLHSPTRDKTERQADKFASYFVMPKKQVINIFHSIFKTDKFLINELTSFALISGSIDDLKNECGDLRALSRKLASTEIYNGEHFSSIAKQFKVSVGAMAIRLEELELLEI
ncbi:MAG: cyclodeaminase/cyclohydrolase family protein [Methylococcaceae bacterium]